MRLPDWAPELMQRMPGAGDLLFYRFGGRLDSSSSGVPGVDVIDEVTSVIEEVTLLLNTRSPLSAAACAALTRRTVLDYGLADFLHLSPLSRQDAQALSTLIRHTILAHELRLEVESVTVETPRPYRDRVFALVAGRVRKRDQTSVAVSFPVRVAMTTILT